MNIGTCHQGRWSTLRVGLPLSRVFFFMVIKAFILIYTSRRKAEWLLFQQRHPDLSETFHNTSVMQKAQKSIFPIDFTVTVFT